MDSALCLMFLSLASTGFFRATQNAYRWRIINQMFAKSLPVDARGQKFSKEASEVWSLAGALGEYSNTESESEK